MNPLRQLLGKLELLLESVLSAADDPEERIRALVADLRGRQAAGRRALGLALALEKRLLAELCGREDEREAWETSAKEALAAGDDERATAAAARLLEARAREAEARARFEEQRGQAARVRSAVEEAARRIGEVAHARSILLARARSAEALQSITATLELLQGAEVARTVGEARLHAERREAGKRPPDVR